MTGSRHGMPRTPLPPRASSTVTATRDARANGGLRQLNARARYRVAAVLVAGLCLLGPAMATVGPASQAAVGANLMPEPSWSSSGELRATSPGGSFSISWAGYIATPEFGRGARVTSKFVVPAVQSPVLPGFASTWAGVGGDTTGDLIQGLERPASRSPGPDLFGRGASAGGSSPTAESFSETRVAGRVDFAGPPLQRQGRSLLLASLRDRLRRPLTPEPLRPLPPGKAGRARPCPSAAARDEQRLRGTVWGGSDATSRADTQPMICRVPAVTPRSHSYLDCRRLAASCNSPGTAPQRQCGVGTVTPRSHRCRIGSDDSLLLRTFSQVRRCFTNCPRLLGYAGRNTANAVWVHRPSGVQIPEPPL